MTKPVAVLISDIHFTVSTLDLAAVSLLKAQYKARVLDIPLIICGDTLDSKAIIRAECANRLMRMLTVKDAPKTYILVGNHELCNEKGEDHSLHFLHGLCTKVVDSPHVLGLKGLKVLLVPYYSNLEQLQSLLANEDNPTTLIMHQGVQTAHLGHYNQDKTSLPTESFANYRVVSGHYHRKQDIKCGRPRKGAIGLFSYIGNPYSLSFGEASDGPKGFQILHDDGLLEFVPTDLRKHIVLSRSVADLEQPVPEYSNGDLVWLKVTGPKTLLNAIDKDRLGKLLFGHSNFKLDKIYDKDEAPVRSFETTTDYDLLDLIINNTSEPEAVKQDLKTTYKELLSNEVD